MVHQRETSGDASSGVAGLDDILGGGFARTCVFLAEGMPGTGKTTLGLQFLMAGAAAGERGLYITMSETDAELRQGATSHGWSIGELIEVVELVPPESLLDAKLHQTLLYSSDLELGEATRQIFSMIQDRLPARVVVDSLSEFRLLAQGSLRYRRQILALKHYFARNGATVLLLDDMTADSTDKTVHSIAHGVINLEEMAPSYGAERRRLRVTKYRGRRIRGGYHDFVIATGGIKVFPRLIAAEHRTRFARTAQSSGIAPLDTLLGGGLERGSSALLLGPAGSGKSLLTLQFISAAVQRGEKAALFVFDEELGLLFDRARNMGLDIEAMRERGSLHIAQIDAAELSPGEFAYGVRTSVDKLGAKIVVIDSLNGYQAAMPEEKALILHMHELLQFLNRQGATTFLTVAQHGLVGEMRAPVDVTYLADSVLLLRYFEAFGRVRRAISVIKKRTGTHEDTIREIRITGDGIAVGEPLTEFQGVLRGVPEFVGQKIDSLGKD